MQSRQGKITGSKVKQFLRTPDGRSSQLMESNDCWNRGGPEFCSIYVCE